MASSAFSFHCMICFEEFDPQTNYPVVLPCGHTYVCIECANRLDKCMECRTPLTMKIELPPPPPPAAGGAVLLSLGTPTPNGVAHAAAVAAGASASTASPGAQSPELQKENHYADRVRNSPGFRRKYGHREQYNNKGSLPPPPPQPLPKQRLPLPKNAVLLSLIQASEPARRRAEVEAPPTPQKKDAGCPMLGSETPSPGKRGGGNTNSSAGGAAGALPKFSRPSPLFLDNSSSGEHDTTNHLQGSSADDEEHKIRVGTYLEGGPCGTYAVASKNGLLVYPTLFEHTLPSALNKMHGQRNGTAEGGDDDVDVVKRDVEELVKKHYRESQSMRNKTPKMPVGTSPPRRTPRREKKAGFKLLTKRNPTGSANKKQSSDSDEGGASTSEGSEPDLGKVSLECHEDEVIEAQCSSDFLPTTASTNSSALSSPTGVAIPMSDDDDDSEWGDHERMGTALSDPGGGSFCCGSELGAMSDPGLTPGTRPRPQAKLSPGMAALAATASLDNEDDNVGLSVSLDFSEDNNDDLMNVSNDSDAESGEDEVGDNIGASVRTLPARRSKSHVPVMPGGDRGDPLSASLNDARRTTKLAGEDLDEEEIPMTKKFVRHCSHGTKNVSNSDNDEFERPLIRLKYGDRVQVVSMDSRGWVKLARGYGYIRLENDKQLVKVGGTSDKACQIEAMLHELSIERNRLKHEQMKLERFSAGLMIDLQSTLITSDDHVVVPAPKGSLLRSDSELSLVLLGNTQKDDRTATNVSLDDIDVSTRSRTVLTPPRAGGTSSIHAQRGDGTDGQAHRQIRTAKSHSPGRSSSNTTQNQHAKPPPSPPYGQVTTQNSNNWSNVNTPTRVNFRTGLSGHRALTSSNAPHPHDFIDRGSGSGYYYDHHNQQYRPVRSMSNHAGISSSSSKKGAASSRGRSIY